LIELVDSPKDTQSLFALEFLPKVRRDLDLVRLKLVEAQRKKEPDAYKRFLLKKQTTELETKERFLERLTTRLTHALTDKQRADATRVDWAKWEIEEDVKAKRAVLEDLRTKIEVFGRLGGQMDGDKLRGLIERGKYDSAKEVPLSWTEWEEFSASETVSPSRRTTELLEEMEKRQAEGARMIAEAASGDSLPPVVTREQKAKEAAEEEAREEAARKKAGGGLFGRLFGRS
jgi:hypothetical protein